MNILNRNNEQRSTAVLTTCYQRKKNETWIVISSQSRIPQKREHQIVLFYYHKALSSHIRATP